MCSASGDRHSRIGLHSYTSRCNTTTDWLGCTSFVSRDFPFQLHVLGPGRIDGAVASPQTSFGVRSSRIQTPKDVYGETNGAEDWEGTLSSRRGTAIFVASCFRRLIITVQKKMFISVKGPYVSFASWRSTKTEKITESKAILCWPQTSSWVVFRFPCPSFSQSVIK